MSAADLLANAELLSTQINFSRYALTASFALQVYEWLAKYVSHFTVYYGIVLLLLIYYHQSSK